MLLVLEGPITTVYSSSYCMYVQQSVREWKRLANVILYVCNTVLRRPTTCPTVLISVSIPCSKQITPSAVLYYYSVLLRQLMIESLYTVYISHNSQRP